MQGRAAGTVALTVACIVGAAGASHGRAHKAAHRAAVVRQAKSVLSPTRVAPKARGKAQLTIVGDATGRFTVSVRHLGANASYDLHVGATKVASLKTNGGGNADLRFGTHPRGRMQALGFDPRGDTVVVRDDRGEDVLVGTVPTGGTEPNAVACCIADAEDGEVGCRLLAPADCGTAAGVVMTANACIPDPCNTGQPPKGMVCCTPGDSTAGAFIDEDSQAGCNDEASSAECAAAGGVLVAADSCDAKPCAGTPPATSVVCCVPDDGEQKCEVLAPERCTGEEGAPSTAASCSPDPCAGTGQRGGETEND